MALRLGLGLGLSGGVSFSPLSLFAASEPGFWFDPSDISTLFQDTAGTTPVTAAGQSVGLVLDKSKGLVLGPERLTNGDFSGGSTGWSVTNADATHIVTFSGGTLRYQSDTITPALAVTQHNALEVGKWYKVTVVCSAWVSGSLKTDVGNGAPVLASGVGTFTNYILANKTMFTFIRNSADVDLTIDNISVCELPGNHAAQSTSLSRPTYQVDSNGRGHLLFDGSDDFLVTPTITPGTDKVQVFAGVRKLSDAARGTVAELTASAASNNGAWHLAAPNAASATLAFESKGTALTDAIASSGVAAPVTAVVTGIADIGADTNIIRINGTQADSDSGDQGTGNFTAAAVYVGRRGGTTLPFNGRIYSLITRFGANLTADQIAQTEAWVNARTGAY